MNVPSLYSSMAFYDSTSALNGNPFYNPTTCGMSGTLRGSCLASNLDTCGLNGFPGGNIGYANRVEGVSGELTDWFKVVAGNVISNFTPTLQQAFDSFLGAGKQKLLEAAGYKMLGPVMIVQNGAEVPGIKAQKKDGSFVVILKDGSEVPFTSAVAAQTKTVDLKTGLTTGQTAGIAVGVVALVALFYFMSKRR
jgi:hypothetical protein